MGLALPTLIDGLPILQVDDTKSISIVIDSNVA
jgi:hypothetical protein